MKTFDQFLEDISPERLAQLDAKGKGDAARAKMKADNLKSGGEERKTEPEQKRLPGTAEPRGGSLAKTTPEPKKKGGALGKTVNTKLSTPDVKKVNVKVDKPRPTQPGTTRTKTNPPAVTKPKSKDGQRTGSGINYGKILKKASKGFKMDQQTKDGDEASLKSDLKVIDRDSRK